MNEPLHPLTEWLLANLPAGPTVADVAVVAPSSPAASAQRDAVLHARGALLGTSFVTAPTLARLVLDRTGTPAPERRPDPVELRERARTLLAGRDDPVARYASRFRGALEQLVGTIAEWQRAGCPRAEPESLSPTGRSFVATASAYGEATRDLATRHTLLERARAAAASAHRDVLPRVVLVAGFTSLPRDLRSLIEVLAHAGCTVSAFAARSVAPPSVARRSTATLLDELRLAASDCAERAGDRAALRRMVVAVPRLAGYARHIERAFGAEGVPFRTPAETPLVREARGALWLHAARLLFDDAPRLSFMALLGTARLRTPVPPDELRLFDELSRREHLHGLGGFDRDFGHALRTALLRGGMAGRSVVVDLCDRWVRELAAVPTHATAAERADLLADFARRTLVVPDGDSRDALVDERVGACLDALARAFGSQRTTGAEFVRELGELLQRGGAPLAGVEHDGVHVVDFDDALAIPAEHVALCGLVDDLVPRTPPTETFLSDRDRRELGLAHRESARESERALLSGLCTHPTLSLVLSRPRRGADGRPVGPTTWWDDLASEAAESRHPAHPEAIARARIATGTCPRDLALAHLALTRAPVDDLAAVGGDTARQLWKNARHLERFEPAHLARDGDLGDAAGAAVAARAAGASSLDTLGHCPHRYLFRHVLGLRALPPEPDPVELPRDRLGTLIHSVLETLMREFAAALGGSADPRELRTAMTERAGVLLADGLATHGGPLLRDFPTLHRLLERRWYDALCASLAWDLERMANDGSRPHAVELEVERTLHVARPYGGTIELAARGRIDRVDTLADGDLRVIDVKSGRNPEGWVDAREVLRGRRLQLPIYALLLASEGGDTRIGAVAVQSVRPAAPGAGGGVHEHALANATDMLFGGGRPALSETLAVLAELRARGAFLPAPENPPCRSCDYRAACRRLHPPSQERVRRAGIVEFDRWVRLGSKSTKAPLLANAVGAEDES